MLNSKSISSEKFNPILNQDNDKNVPKLDDNDTEKKQKRPENDKKNKDSEENFKKKYIKARNKTIDLFGRHMDNIKLKNEIKLQRDEIERQKEKLELAYNRARRRTIELYGKHTDLKKAKQRIEYQQLELIETNAALHQKSREINDSIEYAKKIQQATLPSEQDMRHFIENFFVLFMPRDVVSGDFFWFYKFEKILYIAVADCTGHGVPGAFMSILGSTLLDDIVSSEKFSSPASILNELNKKVTQALKQDKNNYDQADGMDITLCKIDVENQEMELASANQDTYLFIDSEFISIENDLFSVGGNMTKDSEIEFTNRHFIIEPNTTIYLLTDGYKDQFGGKTNKKYGSFKMQEILKNSSKLDFSHQKEFLYKEFLSWRNKNKQIDDVLVIGIDLNSIQI